VQTQNIFSYPFTVVHGCMFMLYVLKITIKFLKIFNIFLIILLVHTFKISIIILIFKANPRSWVC